MADSDSSDQDIRRFAKDDLVGEAQALAGRTIHARHAEAIADAADACSAIETLARVQGAFLDQLHAQQNGDSGTFLLLSSNDLDMLRRSIRSLAKQSAYALSKIVTEAVDEKRSSGLRGVERAA